VICVSDAERSSLLDRYPDAAEKVTVIPNGVDAPRPSEPWPVTERIAMTVCRLEPYKGVERAIRAAAHFPSGWRLVVIGDGSQRRELERLAREMEAPVTFTGTVSPHDRDRWYSTASVVLSMSQHEAFGITVAEALATGLAVVASDIPAHRDLAEQLGGQIELIDSGSSDEELAETILYAAETVTAQRPAAVWSWDQVAEATLCAYETRTRYQRTSDAADAPVVATGATAVSVRRVVGQRAEPESSRATISRLHTSLLLLGASIGIILVPWSYRYASTSQGSLQFLAFWVGFLALACPLGWTAVMKKVTPSARVAALSALGLWDFVPKLIRNPSGPLFSDEIAHWRATVDVSTTGHAFVSSSLIPIIGSFPGEQSLVAAFHDVTGLSVWTCGEVVLALIHSAALIGVYALATRLTGSTRAGAIAGVIWAINPGFMYFDSQYSYESLAVPLLIWTLVAVTTASDPSLRIGARRGWLITAFALSAACIVTHHLTSYVLAGMLAALAVANTVQRRTPATATLAELWAATFFAAGGCVIWLAVAGGKTVSYYSPFLTAGVRQAISIATHAGGGRHLFSGSQAPSLEKFAAYIAPLLCASVVAWGIGRRRSGLARLNPSLLALCATGAVYFLSLPFILTTLGNEAARRSWTFSYLGLALFAAALVSIPGDRASARTGPLTAGRYRARSGLVAAGATLAACTLIVGNTSSAIDVAYRFPGPYVYGSDTRSATTELAATTTWFRVHAGTGAHVITDRYTGLSLAGFAGADVATPSPGFPAWDLFFDGNGAPPKVLAEVSVSPYTYLVTDDEMAEHVPAIGVYFGASEPGAFDHTAPVPRAALGQYTSVAWATEVYRSDDYSIYRLDLRSLRAACESGSCG
jgi:hypothetical protein